ncbi:MAG: DEAD/DEAH box helicase [Candidatus Scalindua sediminis]|nr:DEAD/DEAH box helicase [Candidatus Scalindua sediminis]
MIEIRKGFSKKPASTDRLIKFFEENSDYEGLLYTSYPILFTGGVSTTIDALWLSEKYGIIIFDIIESTTFDNRRDVQDDLFRNLSSLLIQNKQLTDKRVLIVNIEVITYAPACVITSQDSDFKYAINNSGLVEIINDLPAWPRSDIYPSVLAVIQSVIKLRIATKRTNVKRKDSKGAILKTLEDTISNLDQDQENAVIESFDGLHRIRGLAGSGKTIVLALKAAYIHSLYPEWNIAVTFHTRSLKVQFQELIERFCIEKKGEMPDWDKLKILQAWGSPRSEGIYYDICKTHGIEYYDYNTAKNLNLKGKEPFEVICSKALKEISNFQSKYDAILLDEAQDLSEPFLELCFNILIEPKRLIYAYDELQKLNEGSSLSSPNRIFHRDAKDTILSKCYRNSRPVLVTAHALGFGIYRNTKDNLVQFFDQPQLWKEVGYTTKEGTLEAGSFVKLKRANDSSPEYLEKHSTIDDLLIFKKFECSKSQAEWVAEQIEQNLKKDELLYKDIIVINPLAYTTKSEVSLIRKILIDKGISSHIAGEFDSDFFLKSDSITFTGIYRAKGNESPMVYIINADDCYSVGALGLIKRRNTLFTAITRSKAWVRVCGKGTGMERLIEEFEEVKKKNFELQFTYPTEQEIIRMNVIHRDISQSEQEKITQETSTVQSILEIVDRIKRGESYLEDYPEGVQSILQSLMKE